MVRTFSAALVLVVALGGVPAGSARGGAAGRLARTLDAGDDLARACQQAEQRGEPTLPHRAPIIVGRLALAQLEGLAGEERERILDHVYESCLRAKIALLQAATDPTRPADVPAAPSLAQVTLRGENCWLGDGLVFPVAAREAPGTARPFFARGQLVRIVPALAGATPETVRQTEVFVVYSDDPTSRRVGWDRPAGGFVGRASPDGPPVLIAIDHPGMREAIARETAKAIAAWPPTSRPLYASLGSGHFYTDYSELTARQFIGWLKKRYKTVHTVNAVWDSDYRGFDAAMMPTPTQAAASPSRWRDWVAFNQERLTDHIRWACENVRRHAPGVPIGLTAIRYVLAGSLGMSGIDPLALAGLLDVVEINASDVLRADLAAALARGERPVVDAAAEPGAFGILPHLLHGCAAVGLRTWPPGPLDSLEAIATAERILREALDARRLAPAIAALSQAPKPVALLYSLASMRLAPPWALRCAETPYTHEVAKAYQAARFLDVGCGFVTSDDVAKRRWRGARVIVVAGPPSEEDAVVRALVDHVELGGHLVVVAESLVSDDRGREAEYLLRMGIEVLETTRPTPTTRPRPDLGGALDDLLAADAPACEVRPRADGPLAAIRRPLRGGGVRQRIRVNVVHNVLATFPDGEPAIVTYRRGKGAITYLATPLAAEDLALVLQAVVRQAGVAPQVRLVAPDGDARGLECRSVRQGDRLLAYVWNTTGETRWVALQTKAATAALDLSAAAPLPLRATKEAAVAERLRLGPFATAIVGFTLPQPPKAP